MKLSLALLLLTALLLPAASSQPIELPSECTEINSPESLANCGAALTQQVPTECREINEGWSPETCGQAMSEIIADACGGGEFDPEACAATVAAVLNEFCDQADPEAQQTCEQFVNDTLNDLCTGPGTFPTCMAEDLPAGDGFVAGFAIPNLRASPANGFPSPTLAYDGHDIVINVEVFSDPNYAPFSGQIGWAIEHAAGGVLATGLATATAGGAQIRVPRATVDADGFPDGPVNPVLLYVTGPQGRVSNFFTPKESLMQLDAYATADLMDDAFTPILLVDGTLAAPPITVTVTANDPDAFEGTTVNRGQFTFTRTGGIGGDLFLESFAVNFAVSGTATRGTDYTTQPTLTASPSITFPAGEQTVTLNITPILDDPDGGAGMGLDETVIVTIQDSATETYFVGTAREALVTIHDAVKPTVSLALEGVDDVVTEGALADTATINITRSTTAEPLVVSLTLATGAGKATLGDVERVIGSTASTLPLQVNFAAGVKTVLITLRAQDDADVEGIELLDVSLASSAAYTISPTANAVSLTVFDNELPIVAMSATGLTMPETGGSASFTLTRTAASPSSLDVLVRLGGSATIGVDYAASSLSGPVNGDYTATIPGGQTSTTITFTAIGDSDKEGTERIEVTLQPRSTYQLGAKEAAFSILDDDLPVISVTATDNSATEAAGAGRTGNFRLTRVPPASGDMTALDVNITLGGSASSADYTAKDGATPVTTKVTFPANKHQVNVTIDAIDDDLSEPAETVILQIRNAPSGAGLTWGVGNPSEATVTITSDDQLSPLEDTDRDGIPNVAGGGLPADNCPDTPNSDQANADGDAQGDACDLDDDNDGLSDAQEAQLGTNPRVRDTDLDGIADGQEVADGTDPLDLFSPEFRASNIRAGTNGNGVQVTWNAPAGTAVDRYLIFRASDPVLIDSVNATPGGTSYTFTDQTFPGGEHGYYVQAMTPSLLGQAFNSTLAVTSSNATINVALCEAYTLDTDKDGLCDADERVRGTDPTKADTDGDGMSDFDEVKAGRNPTVAQTVGPGGVALTREGPFWIGLALAVAILVVLVVAVVQARRRDAAAEGKTES